MWLRPAPLPAARHSFCSRMLLTCMRAKLFHEDETTDDLFAEIARQACELAYEGVQVPLPYIVVLV